MRIFLFLVSLSYILETTKAIRCLTCTNARSNAQCKRLGKVVECQVNEGACLNEIRRDDRGVLITKRCKQSRACVNNFVQNQRDAWFPVQCNMEHKNTVCRCCCYNDKCNLNTHECPNVDASAPRDTGEHSKSGACHPPHSVPDNGNVTCTNNNFYDSICTFQCDLGFVMVGEEQSTCTGDKQAAVWSSSPAMCDEEDGVERSLIPHNITAITCNDQGPLENGRYDCSEGNDVGSTCKFVCDEGYFLHPQHTTSNTCTKKFSVEEYGWNQPMPCCARGTPSIPGSYPPGAILDVVIALDNPASVGFGNWMNQRRFEAVLRRKLKEFSELTKIGDVSYKTIPESGPLLDYPDTPYVTQYVGFDMVDGPVYHVGVALQQIREISFTKENGDRPEAANVAVVVTIGNVPDEEEEYWIFENALHLRDDGVRVYAVGIGKGEKLRNTLNAITNYEDSRIFQFDDYNELLTAVDRISQAMAPNLCTPRHPTH